jgi:hypothetical protein
MLAEFVEPGPALLDDTRYVLLNGRGAEGQSIFGGIGSAGTLRFASQNPVNPAAQTFVDNRLTINLSAAITAAIGLLINYVGAAPASGNLTMIRVDSPTSLASAARYTALRNQGTTLMPGAGTPFVLFDIVPTWQFQVGKGAGQVFNFGPTIDDDGSIRTNIGLNIRTLIIGPTYAALTAGTTTSALQVIQGIEITPTMDKTSWNPISRISYVLFTSPVRSAGAGDVVTEAVGIDIPSSVTNITNVWTIRSDLAAAQMRHLGPMVIGSTGTPLTTKGIDVAGDFGTRVVAFTAANGANADIAIGTASFIRITGPTAAFSINSIASPFDGKRLILYNASGQAMTIRDEAAALGTAANRIKCNLGAGVDFTIDSNGGAVELIYSTTDSRWIVVGSVL